MTCSVYKLINNITGKCYIGVSRNPILRFKEHYRSPDLIGRTIRKYGKNNFTLETLVISDKDYCFEIEPKIIDAYSTRVPAGYNISPGGDRGPDLTGRKHNSETIKKISIAHKGKKREPFSEEWKRKLGAARKGKKRPPEVIAKWMETKRKNPKIRPPISEETRRKISQAGMGRIPWNKGKSASEETKRKLKRIHSTRKRKPHSEETKRRIGMAIRLSFAKKRAKK